MILVWLEFEVPCDGPYTTRALCRFNHQQELDDFLEFFHPWEVMCSVHREVYRDDQTKAATQSGGAGEESQCVGLRPLFCERNKTC